MSAPAGGACRVFAPMCADFIHPGHLNILAVGASHGEVTVLLMTDHAMREYKRSPYFTYDQRREILLALRHVVDVVPCHGLHTYGDVVLEQKPDFFIHGSDWKTGVQSRARDQVIENMKTYGGQVLEPEYTAGISSTDVHVAMGHTREKRAKSGVLLRAALNGLRRTPGGIARDEGIDESLITGAISGEAEETTCKAIRDLLTEKYGASARDLQMDTDTSVDGVWTYSAADTRRSARVLDRTSAEGDTLPYCRYMDTACAAIAPFKPELIEQLVYVADNNPMNPLVVMNRGHPLAQYAHFLGPVNFYYEVRGERRCAPMAAGDSALILPCVPHSFTSRDRESPANAKVVAVAFSGSVQRELPHLLHLRSARAAEAAGDRRDVASVRRQLLLRKLELRGMTEDYLRSHLLAEGVDHEDAARALEGEGDASVWELIAERFGEPGCLDVLPLLPDEEVVIQRDRPVPSPGIRCLARSRHLPDCGAVELRTTPEGLTLDSRFYQYFFNTSDAGVVCEWEGRRAVCGPMDTLVAKPFVPVTLKGGAGRVLVVKAPGAVGAQLLGECSLLAPGGLDTMTAGTQECP